MSLTRRENYGKGHRYYLDGRPAPGVTTVLGDGFPKPALINWAANTTADFATDHWDELAELPPSERNKRLRKARWDDMRGAGERGTQVHTIASTMALKPHIVVDVPEALTGHVDSYLAFAREWDVVEQLVEVVVVNREYRYMGTLDSIAVLRAYGPERWLLDYKTSRSGVFPENALQLAAYRNAESYLDEHGEEQPLPSVDRCAIVWLRADGYDLVPLQVGDREWRTFLYCQQVARFAKIEREDVVGDALALPRKVTT